MTSKSEEKTSLPSTTTTTNKTNSPSVQLNLEESQRFKPLDESLDEVDEFLEFSTSSNLPSTLSSESIRNATTNNIATPVVNGVTSEKNPSSKHFSRLVVNNVLKAT